MNKKGNVVWVTMVLFLWTVSMATAWGIDEKVVTFEQEWYTTEGNGLLSSLPLELLVPLITSLDKKTLLNIRSTNTSFAKTFSFTIYKKLKFDLACIGGLHAHQFSNSRAQVIQRLLLDNLITVEEDVSLNISKLKKNLFLSSKIQVGLQMFFKAMSQQTKLNLNANNLGNEGIFVLAESLRYNTRLTELFLTKNKIRASGARALVPYLQNNTTLIRLSLFDNNIGNEGAWAIVESLRYNTTLTDLSLSANSIDHKGMFAIGEFIRYNKRLQKLSLRYNTVTEDVLITLLWSLLHNTTLAKLNLSKPKAHILANSTIEDLKKIDLRNVIQFIQGDA